MGIIRDIVINHSQEYEMKQPRLRIYPIDRNDKEEIKKAKLMEKYINYQKIWDRIMEAVVRIEINNLFPSHKEESI